MLRKLLRLIIPLAVICILITSGAMAGGLALSGVGSRAISMGGAFRGMADDWSACYWNPAGLANLEKSEFNGMLTIVSPQPEFTPNMFLPDANGNPTPYSIGHKNGVNHYTHDVNHNIPSFSGFFQIPGMDGVTAGLGLFVPYGTGAVWDVFDLPTGYNTLAAYPEIDYKSEFSVIDIHPTFAKKINDKLSVGVGVSLQKGEIFLQQMRPTMFSTAAPFPQNYFFTDMRLDGDGWGYGANAGIMYQASEKLSVGIAYRSPVTLKLEGITEMDLYTPFNQDLVDIYNGFGTAADSATAGLFMGRVLSSSPDVIAEMKLPPDYGIGFAYHASEKLTFAIDANYTDWSVLDHVPLEFTGVNPLGLPAGEDTLFTKWEGTFRISVGMEYLVSPKLAFRLGYFNDPSPIPDETFTLTIPDISTKNSFNAGVGYDVGTFRIDYNFEYIQLADRTIADWTDTNGDGSLDNFPGDYKMKIYANFISITHRF